MPGNVGPPLRPVIPPEHHAADGGLGGQNGSNGADGGTAAHDTQNTGARGGGDVDAGQSGNAQGEGPDHGGIGQHGGPNAGDGRVRAGGDDPFASETLPNAGPRGGAGANNGGGNAGLGNPGAGGWQSGGGLLGGLSSLVTSLFGGASNGATAGSTPFGNNNPSGYGGNGNPSGSGSSSNFFSQDVPRFIGDTARQIVNDVTPQRAGADNYSGGRSEFSDNRSTNPNPNPNTGQRATADGQNIQIRSGGDPAQPQARQTSEARADTNAGTQAQAKDGQPPQLSSQAVPVPSAGLQAGDEELLLFAGMSTLAGDVEGEEGKAAGNSGRAGVLTAEEMALLATSMAQANVTPSAKADGKETTPQQGLTSAAADPDSSDARTLQQTADGKRANEMLDRSLAKTPADVPTQRATQQAKIIDARTMPAQTRADADAKALRDAGERGRLGNASEASRYGLDANARRALAATANGSQRRYGASESMRQALDWIGQQVRGGRFEDADSNAAGVHAMRVVAGLIVAGVTVAVAIGVLYAFNLAFSS